MVSKTIIYYLCYEVPRYSLLILLLSETFFMSKGLLIIYILIPGPVL